MLIYYPFRTSVCPSVSLGNRPGLGAWLGAGVWGLGSGGVAWDVHPSYTWLLVHSFSRRTVPAPCWAPGDTLDPSC